MNYQIFNRIAACIHNVTGQTANITPQTLLDENLGMSSLDKVRLQVELEGSFAFNFDPLDDFTAIFRSAGSLYDYVAAKVN